MKKLFDYPRLAKHLKLITADRAWDSVRYMNCGCNRWHSLGQPSGVAQAGHNRETCILGRLAALEFEAPKWRTFESKAPKWRSTYKHSLAIRNRSLSSFLMDHFPAQYSSSEHRKKLEGDRSAHNGATLIDSFLNTDGVRSDTSAFTTLYGLLPDSVSLLRKSKHNLSPIARWRFDCWLKLRW